MRARRCLELAESRWNGNGIGQQASPRYRRSVIGPMSAAVFSVCCRYEGPKTGCNAISIGEALIVGVRNAKLSRFEEQADAAPGSPFDRQVAPHLVQSGLGCAIGEAARLLEPADRGSMARHRRKDLELAFPKVWFQQAREMKRRERVCDHDRPPVRQGDRFGPQAVFVGYAFIQNDDVDGATVKAVDQVSRRAFLQSVVAQIDDELSEFVRQARVEGIAAGGHHSVCPFSSVIKNVWFWPQCYRQNKIGGSF